VESAQQAPALVVCRTCSNGALRQFQHACCGVPGNAVKSVGNPRGRHPDAQCPLARPHRDQLRGFCHLWADCRLRSIRAWWSLRGLARPLFFRIARIFRHSSHRNRTGPGSRPGLHLQAGGGSRRDIKVSGIARTLPDTACGISVGPHKAARGEKNARRQPSSGSRRGRRRQRP
jgi:hypothetical protein